MTATMCACGHTAQSHSSEGCFACAGPPCDLDLDSVEVVQTVVLEPRNDGPKGYYGPPVELLLMRDGTVRWHYNDED